MMAGRSRTEHAQYMCGRSDSAVGGAESGTTVPRGRRRCPEWGEPGAASCSLELWLVWWPQLFVFMHLLHASLLLR